MPYTASTIPGQCAKFYSGPRASQVQDQMKRFVPPRFVPDEFEVSAGGFTGLIRNSCHQSVPNIDQHASNSTNGAEQATPTAVPKRRYNQKTDDATLIKLCKDPTTGVPMVVSKAADIVTMAKKIDPNLQYQSVKAAIKRLEKNGDLTRK